MPRIIPATHIKYTDADAITAVEGEGTLDLTGDVTIAGDKSLKVDIINEKDADAGVLIDGVNIIDEQVVLENDKALQGLKLASTAVDLIKLNSSDQTEIGQNNVRATRFVTIDPTVQVLTVDPSDTNFTHEVDVTAQTSANTYAIDCRTDLRATIAGVAGYVRPNGSSQDKEQQTSVIRTQVANSVIRANFTVGVDTNQKFEWAVSATQANLYRIAVVGYWEYVD